MSRTAFVLEYALLLNAYFGMTIAHAVDIFGILLTLGGAAALVWVTRNASLGVTLGGLWIWGGIHFTRKLISHFDSAHGWNPSDTIWLHSGWIPGFLAAFAILLLKFLVSKWRSQHSRAR